MKRQEQTLSSWKRMPDLVISVRSQKPHRDCLTPGLSPSPNVPEWSSVPSRSIQYGPHGFAPKTGATQCFIGIGRSSGFMSARTGSASSLIRARAVQYQKCDESSSSWLQSLHLLSICWPAQYSDSPCTDAPVLTRFKSS